MKQIEIPIDVEQRVERFLEEIKTWSMTLSCGKAKINQELHCYLRNNNKRYAEAVDWYILNRSKGKQVAITTPFYKDYVRRKEENKIARQNILAKNSDYLPFGENNNLLFEG